MNGCLSVLLDAVVICIQCKLNSLRGSTLHSFKGRQGALSLFLHCRNETSQSEIIKRPASHILFSLHHSIAHFLKLFLPVACEKATAARVVQTQLSVVHLLKAEQF